LVVNIFVFCRFYSHFRCIHRGAFFKDMKTTTVRCACSVIHEINEREFKDVQREIVSLLCDVERYYRRRCLLGLRPHVSDRRVRHEKRREERKKREEESDSGVFASGILA